MMIKWIFRLILITLLAAVLHYNLPHRDIVRITDTYEKRVDPGANSWFWSLVTQGVPRAPQTAMCFSFRRLMPMGARASIATKILDSAGHPISNSTPQTCRRVQRI